MTSTLTFKAPLNKKQTNRGVNQKGSSLIELIIVTILFAIFVPVSLGIYISGRKITGQSYIQHAAAANLSETTDILEFLRNEDYKLMINGSFYLIRNPGSKSYLIKTELPDKDTFERYITLSNAFRHSSTNDLYFDGDTGPSYEDTSTKKVEINILWAPDYLPLDLISQTFYITDWQNHYIYE